MNSLKNKVKVENLYMHDKVVKKLFTSSDVGLEYLSKIVCKVLNLSYEDVTFTLMHPEISENENIVNSEVDVVLQNNESIVNVEVNSKKSLRNERKNSTYVCQLLLRQTKKTSDYDKKLKKVYQINLNAYDVTQDGRFVVVSKVLDTETHKEIHPLFEIVDINLAKMIKKDYTIIRKDKESLENLLYLLVCDKEENLEEVYNGDELMAKVVREIKNVVDDFDKLLYYDYDALKKGEIYDEGFDAGVEKNNKEVAKAMLKENSSIEFIAKVTNLSYEDIEKLKEELK